MTYQKLGKELFGIDPQWTRNTYEQCLSKLTKSDANILRMYSIEEKTALQIANELSPDLRASDIEVLVDIAIEHLREVVHTSPA